MVDGFPDPTIECCGHALAWVLPAGNALYEAGCDRCGNAFLWMPRSLRTSSWDEVRLPPPRRRRWRRAGRA